jgi:hypothetical protein
MAKAFEITAVVILVTFLVGCSSVQEDWEMAQKRDTEYSYGRFIEDHPRSGYRPQAESRIAGLRKQREEISQRIAEKLHSKKIGAVVIDAQRGYVPPGAVFHFYPSGKEPQIIAIIERMQLWSLQSGALTLRVSCGGAYQRFGSFDVFPRIILTLEEGEVSYNLADCQDPLAKRLVDEIEEALQSK